MAFAFRNKAAAKPALTVPDQERPDLDMDLITIQRMRAITTEGKFTIAHLRSLQYKGMIAFVDSGKSISHLISAISLRHRFQVIQDPTLSSYSITADTQSLVDLANRDQYIIMALFCKPAGLALLTGQETPLKILSIIFDDVYESLRTAWMYQLARPNDPLAIVLSFKACIDQAADWCLNLHNASWQSRDWATTTFIQFAASVRAEDLSLDSGPAPKRKLSEAPESDTKKVRLSGEEQGLSPTEEALSQQEEEEALPSIEDGEGIIVKQESEDVLGQGAAAAATTTETLQAAATAGPVQREAGRVVGLIDLTAESDDD